MMTELDQSALNAATKAFREVILTSAEGTVSPMMAPNLRVGAAIAAYLDARWEQGYREVHRDALGAIGGKQLESFLRALRDWPMTRWPEGEHEPMRAGDAWALLGLLVLPWVGLGVLGALLWRLV